VVFLAADSEAMPGEVTVDIEGLSGGYSAIWTDSLTARVPDDWMERFGVPDNPNVDESNEGQTYALGVREDIPASIDGDQITVNFTHPGQVVRIVIAQTQAEADRIENWAGEPNFQADADDALPVLENTLSGGVQNGFMPAEGLEFPALQDDQTESPSSIIDGPPPAFCSIRGGDTAFTSRLLSSVKTALLNAPAGVVTSTPVTADILAKPIPSTFASTAETDTVPNDVHAENVLSGARPDTVADGEETQSDTDHVAQHDQLTHRPPLAQPSGADLSQAEAVSDTAASDDLSSLFSGPPIEEEAQEETEDSPLQPSPIAEIATLTGSAFGAALMGILASMAQLVG
jgi:hypothetical protein